MVRIEESPACLWYLFLQCLSLLNLFLDDSPDLVIRDGREVIVIHADVILSREEHGETGKVETTALFISSRWTGVDMPEELPVTIVGSTIAEERVVVQPDLLVPHLDAHLH